MAIHHKTKISYHSPERLWNEVKFVKFQEREKDMNKIIDMLIKKGLEVYNDEKKSI